MTLRVFQRRPIPHVLFQPRFEPWFDLHRQFNSLPHELSDLNIAQVYDLVGASMRYVDYYTGQPTPIVRDFPSVKRSFDRSTPDRVRCRYETPRGDLFETMEMTQDNTWRKVEFPAKTAEDLDALLWLLQRQSVQFDAQRFEQGDRFLGHRGFPQFYVPKSPYFALAQEWMKYEDFIFALADCPQKIHEIFTAIDASYDQMYQQLVSHPAVRIINFGENVAMAYLSLDYWQRYCMPWYEKRVVQLRGAGVFTHVHIDGFFKPLLKMLDKLPFDGIEALTPVPQGDVTLEQIRDAIGNKILLDGIPAVLFLKHHPIGELHECVCRIIEYFHPRLILGVSDELPQGEGEEAFRRLKWVADYSRATAAAESQLQPAARGER